MAGSRRTQRSVRVTVAAALVGAGAVVVTVCVLSSTLVSLAAVLALVAGAGAARIVHGELIQTRFEAAVEHARQARSFQSEIQQTRRAHLTDRQGLVAQVHQRDVRIGQLAGTLLLTERRADRAETLVKREAQRANDAQERLAALLDEVLGTAEYDADADRQWMVRHDVAVAKRFNTAAS